MTAAEIREFPLTKFPSTDEGKLLAFFLREIAAQLAEFNERCKENCTPPKPENKASKPFSQMHIAES